MKSSPYFVKSRKNSWFIFGMFWIVILFHLTALKEIWQIHMISRIANLMMFMLLSWYVLKTLTSSLNRRIWFYYILPGALIFVGLLINFSLNAISNIELLGYFGFALPWVAYLAVPGIMKRYDINFKLLWRYFYYFMLASIILGFLDYWMYLCGLINLRVLETKYGVFLGGWFSIYHMLKGGIPYYRFYADFIEPGSLAMWLLPSMAYAFLSRKYIGLVILSVGLFFTDSLGGWISLVLIIITVSFIEPRLSDSFSKIY